jgi:hypothetical protein
LADEYGLLVAYPDAPGGQWNGCRANRTLPRGPGRR